MNNKVLVFESDKDSAELIKSYIEEYEGLALDKIFEDYQEGIVYLEQNVPQIIIYSSTQNFEFDKKILNKFKNLNINSIVLSSNYTTSIVIQTLREGAKDIISKPIIKKDFMASLDKCSNQEVKTVNKSNIISIFSNKGGIGKSCAC